MREQGWELTVSEDVTLDVQRIGQAWNEAAARSVFADYRSRKASGTLKVQERALDTFRSFLEAAGVKTGDLWTDPESWRPVSWGLTEGFRNALVRKGYAVGTVNGMLSTVKTYCRLAAKAGVLDRPELAMIASVQGYSRRDANRLDENREKAGLKTRLGSKKAKATPLSEPLLNALRDRPDTPQGRRDALIVGLAADLGLRCGEIALLSTTDIDGSELDFYRPKVSERQRHSLAVNGLLGIVNRYLENDAQAEGPLLRASHKSGKLGKPGMSTRAITERVKRLGGELGLKLCCHDLRHSWTARAKRGGTADWALQQAGGWASPAMPARYGKQFKIANEFVKLAF